MAHIGIAFLMKLFALGFVFKLFSDRFGPQKDTTKSSANLYFSMFVEFSPWLMDLYILVTIKDFFRSFLRSLLSLFHFAIGISLILAFNHPDQFEINLPDQKGLAGLYSICSAYSLFRTFRDLAPPNWFEMFGWFEVVLKNVIKLLAVSK